LEINTFAPHGLWVLLDRHRPNDPDPAHRQARQADELRYLEQNGKPWERSVYLTAAASP
jgi:hypothetical protein